MVWKSPWAIIYNGCFSHPKTHAIYNNVLYVMFTIGTSISRSRFSLHYLDRPQWLAWGLSFLLRIAKFQFSSTVLIIQQKISFKHNETICSLVLQTIFLGTFYFLQSTCWFLLTNFINGIFQEFYPYLKFNLWKLCQTKFRSTVKIMQ